MSFQAALFDLDGTLLDTLEDLAGAMNSVLEEEDWPVHPPQAYRLFIGDGVENLVRRALPQEERHPEVIQRCLTRFKAFYSQGWSLKTRPYEGIKDLLEELRRRRFLLGILTNKDHEFALSMVAHFFPGTPFRAVLGARAGAPKKPDPQGALEIARSFELDPARFVYLGDSAVDMKTALSAGMLAVGVGWGFRSREELTGAGAALILDRPLDLLPFL